MTYSGPPFQLRPDCLPLRGGEALTGWSTFIFSPTSQVCSFKKKKKKNYNFFLLKVKSPSESWQLLVGISISAAVEADYMGVVPHTGSDINLPQRGEAIMMLLIDAFICMRVYKLGSSSCLSTACNTCVAMHLLFFFLIYGGRFSSEKLRSRFWRALAWSVGLVMSCTGYWTIP